MISLQLLKLFPDMCMTMLMNNPKISKSKGIALHQKIRLFLRLCISTEQGGSYNTITKMVVYVYFFSFQNFIYEHGFIVMHIKKKVCSTMRYCCRK